MDTTASRLGDFSRLRPEVRLAAWLALGLAVLVVLDQQHYWSSREDFSFGYLVPVFVAYVLYDRWPLLKAILLGDPAQTSPAAASRVSGVLNFFAGLVVAGSLLLFLFGGFLRAVTGPDVDSASALVMGFAGFVLAMGFLVSSTDAQGHAVTLSRRGRVVALLVFPAIAWIVSAPMLLVFEDHVKLVLLDWVVRIVSGVFDVLAFDIHREGNVLVLPRGQVGVADACSGIRSLTACLFAGSFLSAVFLDKFWKKIALLVMSAVLAFGMNIVRSLFLTGWAYAYNTHEASALDADFWGNQEFIPRLDAAGHPLLDPTGLPLTMKNPDFHFITVHDFAGYAVLGLTLAGLLLLLPLLNYKIRLPEDVPPEPAEKPAQD